MGYKAAVQLLKKAESLKLKVTQKCDLLTDSDAWTDQQKLQTVYHQVLVLDLEYALDKKVEQELWTLGFKNHIATLQELSRDKKNPKRAEAQALLSWCLEAGSGFYLTLLQELCTTFGLDLPFRRRGTIYGHIKDSQCTEQSQTQPSSCLYIVQYCLVHLGDIARYRNQRKQAESFYKQAILVSPTSGQPYNQLALLEASQGDRLSTIFHYVRGIAVKNPFPASITNLTNAFALTIEKEGPIVHTNPKMTSSEFIRLFVCVHGLLHSAIDLRQAEIGVKSINATLTALVATQSFSAERLLEMTVVNLYAWKQVNSSSKDELTDDELGVRELVLDLLAGSLSAFLLPVHTLGADESLLDYYVLPAVKFLTYWIKDEPEVLTEHKFSSRLQIWPSLCKFLNNVKPFLKDFDCTKYSSVPLAEDRDMQGFLPLSKAFADLDFKSEELDDKKLYSLIRTSRIVEFGVWLAEKDSDSNVKPLIIKTKNDDKIMFEPSCIQPDPTQNLLEEMKSFSVIEVIEDVGKKISPERRGGILKPQGSLEKSREEREKQEISKEDGDLAKATVLSGKVDAAKLKRVRQNVALQSIFKKMEENKQVKFSVDTADKEKTTNPSKVDLKPIAKQQQQQVFRTQPFNQNHPALADHPKDPIGMNYPNQQQQQMMNYDGRVTKSYGMPSATSSQPAMYGSSMQPPAVGYGGAQMMGQQQQQQQQQQPMQYTGNTGYGQFGGWKPDDRQVANAPSWPWTNQSMNTTYTQPQTGGQDPYQIGYPYGSNQINYFDMTKGAVTTSATPQQATQYSPWGSPHQQQQQQQRNMMLSGYDAANMNMRQAMLKETASMPGIGGYSTQGGGNRTNAVPQGAQGGGYSLFNANGWNPSLPGQLKSTDGMFAGQGGPQSLAQLLEQQNQWQKNE